MRDYLNFGAGLLLGMSGIRILDSSRLLFYTAYAPLLIIWFILINFELPFPKKAKKRVKKIKQSGTGYLRLEHFLIKLGLVIPTVFMAFFMMFFAKELSKTLPYWILLIYLFWAILSHRRVTVSVK